MFSFFVLSKVQIKYLKRKTQTDGYVSIAYRLMETRLYNMFNSLRILNSEGN